MGGDAEDRASAAEKCFDAIPGTLALTVLKISEIEPKVAPRGRRNMHCKITLVVIAAFAFAAAPAAAQNTSAHAPRSKDVPTKMEYYYRVKWGSLKQFLSLYEKNHQPLLEAMRKDGFITSMRTEFPFTHLAGGPRWDVRVTITYRDAAAALNDPAWETRWETEKKRLYKDLDKFATEEALRFSLLEDHWDVVIADFPG
jgi:hypothetical protein